MFSKKNDQRMITILKNMRFSIEKIYTYGRYKIIDKEILRSIEQYLPDSGQILDVGCGFGLISVYFAMGNAERIIHGIDKNKRRISFAVHLANNLDVNNVSYYVQNAMGISQRRRYACVYMLDIIHHLPKDMVPTFISNITEILDDNGILIIKDIDTFPYPKMLFTFILDKILSPKEEVYYWPSRIFIELLEMNNFKVFRHSINDILPYSHVLYICYKKNLSH